MFFHSLFSTYSTSYHFHFDFFHFLYPFLYLLFFVLGGATLQIGQNDRYRASAHSTKDTSLRHGRKGPRLRYHQRRRRRRYLTPLQRTTDQEWTEPPGPPGNPDGNVTWYTLPWAHLIKAWAACSRKPSVMVVGWSSHETLGVRESRAHPLVVEGRSFLPLIHGGGGYPYHRQFCWLPLEFYCGIMGLYNLLIGELHGYSTVSPVTVQTLQYQLARTRLVTIS